MVHYDNFVFVVVLLSVELNGLNNDEADGRMFSLDIIINEYEPMGAVKSNTEISLCGKCWKMSAVMGSSHGGALMCSHVLSHI